MRTSSLGLLSVIALTSLSISICHADTVHKCKNAQGKLLYQKTPCIEKTEEITSWTPKTEVKAQPPIEKKTIKPLVIKQGMGGHYFLQAEVNSHNFTFVVDTGATMVALPRAAATAASMFCNDKGMVDTANGQSQACTATITEFKLGDFVFKNVTALIIPKLTQPLLGMNVLQGLDIQQKNGEMWLSERDTQSK